MVKLKVPLLPEYLFKGVVSIYLMFSFFFKLVFFLGNAPLKYDYLDFLESFHFFCLTTGKEQLIFWNRKSFLKNDVLQRFIKFITELKSLSNNVNRHKSAKKELRCLNTLGAKSLITELYFYRKRILPKMHLTNSGMIFKGRYFFLMELRILVV